MNTTRRKFLRHAAALLAAGGSQSLLCSATAGIARSAPRPFGFSLYGMKALPLVDAIDHVARIGYRQIELALIPGFAAEPVRFTSEARRAVRERIRAHGLELSSLLINISLTGDERAQAANCAIIQRAAEVGYDLAASSPPVVETILGGKTGDWEAGKEQYVVRLRIWAEAAQAARVTLCVKAHAGQAVNHPDRLLWLYRQVNHPSLALTYDYSHYQYEGLGLEETLRAVLPHTRFIHVKDVAVGEKSPRYLLVGDGAIDYPKYFRLLDALRYVGPVMVEVSAQIHNRPGYDGVKAAEQAWPVPGPHRELSGLEPPA